MEPLHRAPDDQAALFLIDGIERSAEFLGRPGFHFDEDEFLSVAADEIDLAAVRGPEISPEDFVAAFAKVPGGDALAFAPEAEVRGLSPILKISHRSRMWHRLSSLCLSRFTGWKACATFFHSGLCGAGLSNNLPPCERSFPAPASSFRSPP